MCITINPSTTPSIINSSQDLKNSKVLGAVGWELKIKHPRIIANNEINIEILTP